MWIGGVRFKSAWGASGVQGFFGEGYWFHPYTRFFFDANFGKVTFVAKTTTIDQRLGNMPLKHDYTPQKRFPNCIITNYRKGVALNSVGLSGPGAKALLARNEWQKRTEPFMISFMAVGKTIDERIDEYRRFVELFRGQQQWFRAPFAIQLNFSCPNTELDLTELTEEVWEALDIMAALKVPLVPKFNALLPISSALRIAKHSACGALCVSNTIPWGAFPKRIPWRELFGSEVSPLAHLGGGGLSGRPLLLIVRDWVRFAVEAGITKPINACGGILDSDDVRPFFMVGAKSVSLGSISFLRPHKVAATIAAAEEWADIVKAGF